MQVTVLSLMQPWASLVVMGQKKIETRDWDTPFRGELYIHASLGKYYGNKPYPTSCRELCYKEPFNQFINGGSAYDKLPFGAIIGKVNLVETAPVNHFISMFGDNPKYGLAAQLDDIKELAFGDFSSGRYGWLLSDPIQFVYPIPCKGKLGFWNYELTENIQP